MNLTRAGNSANNAAIAAKSAVWVDLQHKQHKRPGAHLKRFFCAHNLSMVGCVGASSDAAVLVPAKVNPAQPATLLLLDLNLGGSPETHKDTIMTVFVIRDGISDKECREQIRIYAFQAHALTQLINDAVDNCQVGDVSPDIKDHLGWAFWALSDVLRAQIALCERQGRVD